jgi:hypothetical protein
VPDRRSFQPGGLGPPVELGGGGQPEAPRAQAHGLAVAELDVLAGHDAGRRVGVRGDQDHPLGAHLPHLQVALPVLHRRGQERLDDQVAAGRQHLAREDEHLGLCCRLHQVAGEVERRDDDLEGARWPRRRSSEVAGHGPDRVRWQVCGVVPEALEHLDRGVHADHGVAQLRQGHGEPAGADAELEDPSAGPGQGRDAAHRRRRRIVGGVPAVIHVREPLSVGVRSEAAVGVVGSAVAHAPSLPSTAR